VPRARPSIARTEYLPEFGRAVRILEYDRPMMSDDVETAQTVSYMDEIAARDADDPAVTNAMAEALADANLDWDASPLQKAHAVYWWLKRTIRYVPTPGTSPLVDQTLITPCTVLAMPEPIGDCPQFSMLACAMFRVLCMDSLFVTIAAEEALPDVWSHVYNTVEVAPRLYMPFDSSNGPEPGAEYARPYKRKVWPRIAPDRCNRKEANNVLRSNYAGRVPTMRNRTLRGAMGDISCDSDGNCYDTAAGTLVYSPTDPSFNPGGLPDQVNPGLDLAALNAGSSAPSSSSAPSWLSALITDVGNIGTSLVKSATAPKPYYVTAANGQQVLYNPATGAAVATPGALGSISPTVILFGVLGLGAVALLSKK
jgi:transglutaminase superfamily protein